MQNAALDGGLADPPRDAAYAFRAALGALARPGTLHEIAGATAPPPCSAAAATLIATLCDPTTPLYIAPSHEAQAFRDWITFQTGAPLVAAQDAVFAIGTWDALAPLAPYAVGTPAYPDRSTTLIVETPALEAQGAVLSGPGIETTARLSLPEIAAFQQNRARFPLGLDFFFTCGSMVAGLPRSTHVTEG
ncbi:MAG: phosphonate C-P lyase system protein PhnH [Pseudomonadota bacterium]